MMFQAIQLLLIATNKVWTPSPGVGGDHYIFSSRSYIGSWTRCRVWHKYCPINQKCVKVTPLPGICTKQHTFQTKRTPKRRNHKLSTQLRNYHTAYKFVTQHIQTTRRVSLISTQLELPVQNQHNLHPDATAQLIHFSVLNTISNGMESLVR